ncbi:MAG: hypothetical protein B7Z53_05870, partial [Rhodospirillales bacterium 12-71-4]
MLRLFYTPTRRREAGPLCAIMAQGRRPYREVTAEDLARIAGTEHHGGLVAIAVPRAMADLTAGPFPPALLKAPVLPRVFEPAFCQRLIATYEAVGGGES